MYGAFTGMKSGSVQEPNTIAWQQYRIRPQAAFASRLSIKCIGEPLSIHANEIN
jgi:hypothetical protein